MYAYIKGELTERKPGQIVIETSGIGYRIFITGQTYEQLPATGEELKVYTYLYLREDAMILYGFLNQDDLELFKLLLGVSGIGPKGAIAVLSVLSADDLRFAILSGDAKTISKAQGVGTKTAQRVVLELKDKLSLEDAIEKKSEHMNSEAFNQNHQIKNDAVLALTALGYTSTESMKAVSNVTITEDMSVEDVLKQALKQMAFL